VTIRRSRPVRAAAQRLRFQPSRPYFSAVSWRMRSLSAPVQSGGGPSRLPDPFLLQGGAEDRLGEITVKDREVLLGQPIRFTRENIDNYHF
jgi:hypothetical protein